jgi:hypothetical protein
MFLGDPQWLILVSHSLLSVRVRERIVDEGGSQLLAQLFFWRDDVCGDGSLVPRLSKMV